MANEKHAFVILTPGFAGNEQDINCIPAQQSFIKNIKQQHPNLDIIVIAFQYPHFKGEYNWNGCRVIAMGGKGRAKLLRLLLWRKVVRQLRSIAKESTIKGILSFWCGECALIGNRFGRKNNIVHKCWIMGQDAKKENKYVKRIKADAAELIALSDLSQTTFKINHNTEPQFVIPLGIEYKENSITETDRDIDLLGVGNLIPLKRYHLFIEIVAELKKHYPNIKARICGKGPEEEKLRSLIEMSGLSSNISLLGEMPHDEILGLMKRSRILLHPSSFEGFGIVCLEALSSGMQVVSFVRPMNQQIEKWYIANDLDHMTAISKELLSNKTCAKPVIPFQSRDSAKRVLKLFGVSCP